MFFLKEIRNFFYGFSHCMPFYPKVLINCDMEYIKRFWEGKFVERSSSPTAQPHTRLLCGNSLGKRCDQDAHTSPGQCVFILTSEWGHWEVRTFGDCESWRRAPSCSFHPQNGTVWGATYEPGTGCIHKTKWVIWFWNNEEWFSAGYKPHCPRLQQVFPASWEDIKRKSPCILPSPSYNGGNQ